MHICRCREVHRHALTISGNRARSERHRIPIRRNRGVIEPDPASFTGVISGLERVRRAQASTRGESARTRQRRMQPVGPPPPAYK